MQKRSILITAIEFITATLIIGVPIYGSWLYYLVTGKPLQF